MKKQFGYTLIEICVVLFLLVGGVGWVWNIVKLVGMSFDHITGLLIVRAIGIPFVPLGAVMGYIPN